MTNPKRHPLWDKFREWAEPDGVPLDDPEDWLPWWKCFLAGAAAVSTTEINAALLCGCQADSNTNNI